MGFMYVNYKWNQKIARTAEGRGQKEGGRRVSKVGAVRAPLSHLEDSSTLDLHFSTFLRQQGHKASTRPAPASWSKVRKRICGRTEPRHASCDFLSPCTILRVWALGSLLRVPVWFGLYGHSLFINN